MEDTVASKITAFFARYPEEQYGKHELLVYANESPRGIFHLVSGQVRQYDISVQGTDIVVNVFKPPAFFPMSWALTHIPNRYFFETIQTTRVRVAPPDDVVTFLHENSDVLVNLMTRLYSGVEGMQRRMAHLMGGSARTRILFELGIAAKRFGTQGPDGSYAIPLHESQLANRSGLARETANRELMALKEQGLITIGRKQLIVPSLDALEQELGEQL